MKTLPLRAELLLADGQTDGQTDRRADGRADGRTDRHDEATSRFSQFCEVPKNHIKSGGKL